MNDLEILHVYNCYSGGRNLNPGGEKVKCLLFLDGQCRGYGFPKIYESSESLSLPPLRQGEAAQ
jgi:hypothetical protein